MGRIVAIGGGGLQSTEAINKFALDLVPSERPKVLFVPTAYRDNEKYIADFRAAFEALNCEVDTLELVKSSYSDRDIDNKLGWMDMVYIGGGNTVFMMNQWRKIGFDQKLKTVFADDDAVLSGSGAGCVCWFTCGYSNSEYYDGKTDWQYIWADDMLDLHHAAVCPHYNEEGRSNFDRRLIEKGIPGYALEDNTALVQIGEKTEFVASHPGAKAFYLVYLNGEMMKKEIQLRHLVE